MEYQLRGRARANGYRKPLGRLSIEAVQEGLKSGQLEAVNDPKTGLAKYFVPCERESSHRWRTECNHTVTKERLAPGTLPVYSPSRNIRREIENSRQTNQHTGVIK